MDQSAEWPGFFVEAVTDYIVHQEKPQGYISDDNAEWLIRAISRDGAVDTAVEMELLVSVLEKAKSSPERLSAYALEQVALAVIDGAGRLAGGRTATRGVVDKGEVDLLRRVLYAFGGDGNIAITRAEAETLFRINDGTSEELNHPSWNELFVKVVANFVLSSSGYEPPSRTEACAATPSSTRPMPALAVSSPACVGRRRRHPRSLCAAGLAEAGFEDHNRANNVRMRRAETVSAEEARWIADRIGRDHVIRENERALLSFIRQAARRSTPSSSRCSTSSAEPLSQIPPNQS